MAEKNNAEKATAVQASVETSGAESKGAESKNAQSKDKALSSFDCLAVTQVQVFPFKEGPSLGHMKGLAQIVLNDQMVIRGLRVMDGVNGLFVSYPLDPFYKGEDFKSICNPITRQLREHIENCVLEKYQAAVA
ncbi:MULTISPECIES: SpoVG family protein [Fibrobacter]|uniref:SpoVG family protein n=1 Tax=Fibrobacter TaxID=832 RepID=UPI0025BA075A|nr:MULTISPECIES: SpoVG family protein [Fibrobacter]